MKIINFFKLTAFPTHPEPNAVYFIKTGDKVTQYITSLNSDFIQVTESNLDTNTTITAQNKDSVTIYAGMLVTSHASGSGIIRADASQNGAYCIGIAIEDIAPQLAGLVQMSGIINLSDWSRGSGLGNLGIKATYYLDIQGRFTVAPSEVGGFISQQIGVSIDAETMDLQLGYPILL